MMMMLIELMVDIIMMTMLITLMVNIIMTIITGPT